MVGNDSLASRIDERWLQDDASGEFDRAPCVEKSRLIARSLNDLR